MGGNTSVSDVVSYPGGDTTDRVRFQVIGLNPISALPGGKADLNIIANCSGIGVEKIGFTIGTQTFGCGQTLVFEIVTADTDSGTITITAGLANGIPNPPPVYVTWTLVGLASVVH